jgi:hypothetical protein
MKRLLLLMLVFALLCALFTAGALLVGRSTPSRFALIHEVWPGENDRVYLWDTLREVHHLLPTWCGIPISSGSFFGQSARRARAVTARELEGLLHC